MVHKTNADPPARDTANAIPPSLPPSVEEAYRRKCIQLKQRTGEVEEANDASRLRLARLKRQVEKMRVERAFLLEQLSRRTSTNVEDSEGSPSPPPSPQEKPLRTKRGHRKASLFGNAEAGAGGSGAGGSGAGTTFINQTLSPSSETFAASQKTNGVAGRASEKKKSPPTAFELFAADRRAELEKADRSREDEEDEEVSKDELKRAWDDLPADEADEYSKRAEEAAKEFKRAEKEEIRAGGGEDGKDNEDGKKKKRKKDDEETADADAEAETAAKESGSASEGGETTKGASSATSAATRQKEVAAAAGDDGTPAQDEDVEMGDDTEPDQPSGRDKQDD